MGMLMCLQRTARARIAWVRIVPNLIPDKLELRHQLSSFRCRARVLVHGRDQRLDVLFLGRRPRQSRVGGPGIPFVLFFVRRIGVAFRSGLYIADIALHGLFVETVEFKAFAYGGFLRAGADLVDGVEGMSEDAVYRCQREWMFS